jgi:hypothetical protein
MLLVLGQAGGNYYTNKGGGSNYLCLPNDPDNGKPYSFPNDVVICCLVSHFQHHHVNNITISSCCFVRNKA